MNVSRASRQGQERGPEAKPQERGRKKGRGWSNPQAEQKPEVLRRSPESGWEARAWVENPVSVVETVTPHPVSTQHPRQPPRSCSVVGGFACWEPGLAWPHSHSGGCVPHRQEQVFRSCPCDEGSHQCLRLFPQLPICSSCALNLTSDHSPDHALSLSCVGFQGSYWDCMEIALSPSISET